MTDAAAHSTYLVREERGERRKERGTRREERGGWKYESNFRLELSPTFENKLRFGHFIYG